MDLPALLPLLLLLAGAIAILFTARRNAARAAGLAWIAALGALAATARLGEHRTSVLGVFETDPFGRLLGAAVVIALVLSLFATRRDETRPDLQGALLLSAAAFLLLLSTRHLLFVWAALEAAGFAARRAASAPALAAPRRASWAASLVLAAGVVLFYVATGSFRVTELESGKTTAPLVTLLAVGFVVAGVLAVSAASLVRLARGAAPPAAPAAVFFGTALVLAGPAVSLQLLGWLPPFSLEATLVGVAAAVVMTAGHLAALVAADARRLVVSVVLAHGGFLLLGAAGGGDAGRSAVGFAALVLAGTSFGLFAIAFRFGERGFHLAAWAGLGRRHPWRGAALGGFFLALVGLAPTAGFIARTELLDAALEGGLFWLAAVGLLNSFLGVLCAFRLLATLFARTHDAEPRLTPIPRALAASLFLALAALLLIALRPDPVLAIARRAAAGFY